MANFSNSLIPGLFLLIILYGLWKKTDVFSAFLQGASQGLADAVEIFPALLALMTAIAVFKASGALEILSYAAGPLLTSVGLPRGNGIPFGAAAAAFRQWSIGNFSGYFKLLWC